MKLLNSSILSLLALSLIFILLDTVIVPKNNPDTVFQYEITDNINGRFTNMVHNHMLNSDMYKNNISDTNKEHKVFQSNTPNTNNNTLVDSNSSDNHNEHSTQNDKNRTSNKDENTAVLNNQEKNDTHNINNNHNHTNLSHNQNTSFGSNNVSSNNSEKSQNNPPDSNDNIADNTNLKKEQQEMIFNVTSIQENDVVLGNINSSVVVIEYTSLTCAHCAHFHTQYFKAIEKDFIESNKIAYVVRDYIGNKQDLYASVLCRCAKSLYDSNKYMQIRSVLFEQQKGWGFNSKFEGRLTNIGQIAGISAEKYMKCIEDLELKKYLVNTLKTIYNYPGFDGTPFFIINGKIVEQTYDSVYDLISKEVKKAQSH